MVALGGAVGSVLRYGLSLLFNPVSTTPVFPWGTFLANILGCFFIGLLAQITSEQGRISPEAKLLQMTGFCGGFTTFSTFSLEGVQMLRAGAHGLWFLYSAGSLFLGLGAVYLGFVVLRFT